MRSILLLPFALAACAAGPAGPGGPVFNGEATARVGETVSIGDVRITPLEVVEDSRCPTGVMCVHAGFFRVRTEIRTASERRTEIVEWNRGIALSDARSLRITEITPPRPQGPIQPSAYRITYTLGPGD